jgi:Domain of unknown function (DUF6429)
MEIDTDKIDEAVLALLYLTLHDGVRAWKGHDWDALDRLHRKGLIYDPVGKTKSVVFTDAGLTESERLFRKLFTRSTPSDQPTVRQRRCSGSCSQWRVEVPGQEFVEAVDGMASCHSIKEGCEICLWIESVELC